MAWLPGYAYRKPLVLTGGASGAQTDFQLDIDIAYVAAKMQADFDDIRFTQNDGTTLIDAWLESKVDSASAKTWAEFPTTPANTVEQTYYMYYGKAGDVSDWDIGATFLIGDDGLGGSPWTDPDNIITSRADRSIVIEESMDVCRTIYINTALPTSFIFESEIKLRETGNYIMVGAAQSGNIASNNVQSIYLQDTESNEKLVSKTTTAKVTLYNFPENEFHIWGMVHNAGTEDTFFKNRGLVGMHNSYITGSVLKTSLSTRNSKHTMKWIFVRKYAANPPTYQFGAEESAPTEGNPFWYYQMLRRRNQ